MLLAGLFVGVATASMLLLGESNGLTADEELAEVRALATAGDDTGLAEFLDGRMVSIPGGWFEVGSDGGRSPQWRMVRSWTLRIQASGPSSSKASSSTPTW